MSHPNPFAQSVPAEQATQPAANNPFAQQAAPTAPVAPQQAHNPFAQQQAAPPAPQAYAPAQQAPQQQYAPPAAPQQTYAPQQQYAATQAYAPAPQAVTPQQWTGPAQQHAAPPALGTASAPPPPVAGGGTGAKLAAMYGRLVVIFPHVVQRVPKNAKFVTEADRANGNLEVDRMTATVVVLDDGRGGFSPIGIGGNPEALGGSPHTEFAPLPYLRKGMWLNQSQLIGQLTDYLPGRPRGGADGRSPGVATGRLVKTGPEQNAPWFLTTPSDAELKLANDYLGLVMQGTYPHPLAP